MYEIMSESENYKAEQIYIYLLCLIHNIDQEGIMLANKG